MAIIISIATVSNPLPILEYTLSRSLIIKKYVTHIECRTLRWKEISKQENKNLLPHTPLTVVNREQKAAQSFGTITIAKDYAKV
jgi:hypothetical protein